MDNPLISVLVPVYNHEQYIAECIESIWSQRFADVEIIAIDDGSTDGGFGVLECRQRKSPVRMLIARQQNQGIVKTLNAALHMAHGRYVLCIASDDKLLPNALVRAADEITRARGIRFAIFGAMYFGDVDRKVYSEATIRLLRSDHDILLRQLYVDPPKPLLLQSTIISRDLLVELGGWNEKVVLDDWPMFIRLFQYVGRNETLWRVNDEIQLAGYRIHRHNSHKDFLRQIRMIEEVIREYCPAELQAEAFANTYLDYGLSRLRRGDPVGMKLLLRAMNASGTRPVIDLMCRKLYHYYSRH